MLLCVDGSGPDSDIEYEATFRTSFLLIGDDLPFALGQPGDGGYSGLETGRWSLGDEYRRPDTSEDRREWIRQHGLIFEDGDLEAFGGWITGDPSDGVTTITMAQEERGAEECIRWMWPHLLRHGVVRGGSPPSVVRQHGDFWERY